MDAEIINRPRATRLKFASLLSTLCIGLILLLSAAGAAAPAAAASKNAKPAAAGQFVLEWGQFRKANRPAARVLRKSGAMQRLVRRVNRMVTLPHNLPILFSDLIDAGPAYLPEAEVEKGMFGLLDMTGDFMTESIRLLHPQVKDVRGLGARRAMILSLKSVLVHEMGHALVDKRRLPITGREEDAVDGFAAFVLMRTPGFGPLALLSTAALFEAIGEERGELVAGHFSDEHSLPQQRVYQMLCWIYGSAPKRYRSIIDEEDGLPRSRATLCRDEYRQLVHSWGTLIRDYAKPPRARSPLFKLQ